MPRRLSTAMFGGLEACLTPALDHGAEGRLGWNRGFLKMVARDSPSAAGPLTRQNGFADQGVHGDAFCWLIDRVPQCGMPDLCSRGGCYSNHN
jgi:hypothetical protein